MTPPQSIEQRLMEAVRAWLAVPITTNDPDGSRERARQQLAGLTILLREEDRSITPESDKVKRPRLILNATDQGRVKPYAPFRTLRIVLTVRANSKVPAGQTSPYKALCGALELLLDTTNLLAAWSSTACGIVVMLAVRPPGVGHGVEGVIRTAHYGVEVKAVLSELTTV